MTRATRRACCLAVVILGTLAPSLATAQGPLGDPTLRPAQPPVLREEEPRSWPLLPTLPPLPPLPQPERDLSAVRLTVREIRVTGSTVFGPGELARVTAPYVGRPLTSEDLEDLRIALTRLYVDRGYVNSGAVLPDQDVRDGVLVYQIVEGRLTEVDVSGLRWFRPRYVESRLALGAGTPLNVNTLQERLHLLLDDPRFRRLNADLRPGLVPGEAVLAVEVEERQPYRLTLDVNNHQSPTVGAERGIASLEHQNLTGYGDVVTLRYGRSEGLHPLLDFRYALPVTKYDTVLSAQYRRNAIAVIAPAFRDLEVESDSEIYTVGVRQPIYRTLTTEVALEFLGERLEQETRLLGERFSLSPGARAGRSAVTAFRAAQEVVHRTRDQVLAARSRFSFGVDAFGATINPAPLPDGRFFAWLGQAQVVRRFPDLLGVEALFRADLQLADRPILTLEQFPVGGRFTVRGYRENTLVRDNAFVTSLEARVPLLRGVRGADILQLAPFVDYGRSWSAARVPDRPVDIASVGIGLRWAMTIPWLVSFRPQIEVYWGHPLRRIRTGDDDLQDHGIHFQALLTVF